MNDRDAWTQHVTRGDVARASAALAAKPSKYRNRKTTVDGIVFDSAKEAKRYQELRMLELAGQIGRLRWQVSIALDVKGTTIGRYVADFAYETTGAGRRLIIEDVKSAATKTPLYRWKKKHLEAQYDLTILET